MGYALNPTCSVNAVPATCANSVITLSLSSDPGVTGYTWNGDGIVTANAYSTTATPTVAGTSVYTVIFTGGGVGVCSVAATYTVAVTVNSNPASITGNLSVCAGGSTSLTDVTGPGGEGWTTTNGIGVTVTGLGVVSSSATSGTATITYTGSNNCTTTADVTVNLLPSIIHGSAAVCKGSIINLSNDISGGTWTTTTPTSNISINSSTGDVTGHNAGTATATYTLGGGCFVTAEVSVNALPGAITNGAAPICIGSSTTLSDADAGGTWVSSSPANGSIGSSSGTVTGIATGTAMITYTNANSCYVTAIVTVNAPPEAINGSTPVCEQSTITLTDAVTGGSWATASGLIATIDPVTGLVTGQTANPVTFTNTVSVTYTIEGCAHVENVIVTVNLTPANITGTLSVCQGLNTNLNDATPNGTWSSSNTAVGTVDPSSGIVTALIAGPSVQTTTITYLHIDGCSVTNDVTVNPLPGDIGGSVPMCPGISGSISLSEESIGGTWSSDNALITVDASGNVTGANSIINSTVNATITYKFATGCLKTTVVTVNPTPQINTITGVVICDLQDHSTIHFSTTLTSSITPTYDWTASDISIFEGGSVYAHGTADTFPGFQALDPSSSLPTTSTITITATANSCTNTTSFVITVNPTPTVATVAPADQILCDGATTTEVDFTGSVAGAAYNWISSNTSIANTGTGNILAFVANDSSASPLITVFTVSPFANGCSGNPITFAVTVNPTPHLLSLTAPAICDSSEFDYIPGSATATTSTVAYAWSRAIIPGISNDVAAGPDNIAEQLYDTSVNPVNVVYIYTLTANSCVGTDNVSVVVNPSPKLNNSTTTFSLCSGSPFSFNNSSATAGSSYSWTSADVAGISAHANAGTGNINETLINSGDNILQVVYVVTDSANGCAGPASPITLNVKPTPRLFPALTGTSICDLDTIRHIPVSPTENFTLDSFQWSRPTLAGIIQPGAAGSDSISEILSDTLRSPVPVLLTYSYTVSVNGCSIPGSVVDTVKPMPLLKYISAHNQCNNVVFVDSLESYTQGATFAWQMQSSSVVPTLPSGSTTTIRDQLTNPTDASSNIVFITTVSANGCNNPGQRDSVWVKPTARLLSASRDTACSASTFGYNAVSSVTDNTTNFEWSVVHIDNNSIDPSNAVNSGSDTSGVISQPVSSHYAYGPDSLNFMYLLINSDTRGSCTDTVNVRLIIMPRAHQPVISAPINVDTFCNGLHYQNFSSLDSDKSYMSHLSSAWSVTPSTNSIFKFQSSAFATNCLINIDSNTAAPVITEDVWVTDYPACHTSGTFDFSAPYFFDPSKTVSSPSVYLYKDEKTLFCDTNTVVSYQWGYDDNDSLLPHLLYDKFHNPEVNQDCEFIGVSDENPFNIISVTDATKSFWVKTFQVVGNVTFVEKSYVAGTAARRPNTLTAPVMLVYPNPTHADLSFELTGVISDALTVEIYDILGKKIQSTSLVNNKATISVGELPQGSFIAVCRDNGRVITSSHFIKN